MNICLIFYINPMGLLNHESIWLKCTSKPIEMYIIIYMPCSYKMPLTDYLVNFYITILPWMPINGGLDKFHKIKITIWLNIIGNISCNLVLSFSENKAFLNSQPRISNIFCLKHFLFLVCFEYYFASNHDLYQLYIFKGSRGNIWL